MIWGLREDNFMSKLMFFSQLDLNFQKITTRLEQANKLVKLKISSTNFHYFKKNHKSCHP